MAQYFIFKKGKLVGKRKRMEKGSKKVAALRKKYGYGEYTILYKKTGEEGKRSKIKVRKPERKASV